MNFSIDAIAGLTEKYTNEKKCNYFVTLAVKIKPKDWAYFSNNEGNASNIEIQITKAQYDSLKEKIKEHPGQCPRLEAKGKLELTVEQPCIN